MIKHLRVLEFLDECLSHCVDCVIASNPSPFPEFTFLAMNLYNALLLWTGYTCLSLVLKVVLWYTLVNKMRADWDMYHFPPVASRDLMSFCSALAPLTQPVSPEAVPQVPPQCHSEKKQGAELLPMGLHWACTLRCTEAERRVVQVNSWKVGSPNRDQEKQVWWVFICL